MASKLMSLNLQVVVYDSLEYCATLNNLQAVRGLPNFKASLLLLLSSLFGAKPVLSFFSALQFVKGDIQCADLVRFVLDSEEIDTIMHFAAQVSYFTAFCGSLCCM